jgi:hypothetical protein
MSYIYNMTKKEFMFDHFRHAAELGLDFMAIRVRMDGFRLDETIINRRDNMEDKISYWDTVYDDQLLHKYSPGISIIGWYSADTYDDIQKQLDR